MRTLKRITLRRVVGATAILLGLQLILAPERLWAAYTFTTIDYPGAGATQIHGVNDKGHVVGSADGIGFLWKGGNKFIVICGPLGQIMIPHGINNKEQIVGSAYQDGRLHGFVREKDATVTIVDPPGSGRTIAYGINDKGAIVGTYDAAGNTHGFVLRNGEFVTIDVPAYPLMRYISINSAGQIAGTMTFGDGNWPRRGFIYAGGVFTALDEADARSGDDNPPNTWVTGFDDALRVVGYYLNHGTHGFVLAGGKFTTVDVPDANETFVLGSNTAGLVVGYYYDVSGQVHGFMATP